MKSHNYSEKNRHIISVLTLLWMVTLPLRNSILTFSVSGLEIYPNFIVTLLLFAALIPTIRTFSGIQKIILLFLAGWAGFAVVFLLIKGISIEGIFDLHSLAMQFLAAFILFGLSAIFNWEEFKRIIRDSLRFYLLLLLVFGLIELLTAYHIVGPNVSKLTEYPVSSTFYAPFFIYDNNNDYCAYLALLIGLLYLFDDLLRKKNALALLLVFLLFFFARFAQARLAEYISYAYFILFLSILAAPAVKMKFSRRDLFFISSFLVALVLLFASNTFFNGKAYLKTPGSHLNRLIVANQEMGTIVTYQKLEKDKQEKLKVAMADVSAEDNSRSDNIRIHLIYNGLDMIKNHPVTGEGPGSFRLNHKENKFRYPTETVSNPHNFVIEVISQFGIWGWGYFALLTFLLFRSIPLSGETVHPDRKAVLIFLILIYPFIGLIPSSFLYINLHWLFLPLITCFIFYSRDKLKEKA